MYNLNFFINIKYIYKSTTKTLNTNIMNRILIPVDFSENALAATRYAATLAKVMNWSLHLIHSYLAYSSNFATDEFNQEIHEYETDIASQNMKQFLDDLRAEFPELVITSEIKEGVLSTVIEEAIKTDKYALVIMGTKGATGLKSVVMGSNTFDVIKNTSIPTLAVPEQPFTTILSRVGLLTNFKESEFEVLKDYIHIFGKPESLILFHMMEKNSDKTKEDLKNWAEQIKAEAGLEQVECVAQEMIERLDVREHFPDYIFRLTESQKLGILLVTKERKSFISRLFSRNLVKALAHELKNPVFFHTG